MRHFMSLLCQSDLYSVLYSQNHDSRLIVRHVSLWKLVFVLKKKISHCGCESWDESKNTFCIAFDLLKRAKHLQNFVISVNSCW